MLCMRIFASHFVKLKNYFRILSLDLYFAECRFAEENNHQQLFRFGLMYARAYMNYTDLHNDIFNPKADCLIGCDQG